jgi:organic radical activating enzyme
MYGGEPFLIKKFSSVLETAIEKDYAKNIRLHYNTNGSVWPDKFVEHWKHFQHVDIHFSLDAVGKQFELQRGGKWEDVEANILRIKNLNYPNMSFSIMPAVSIMNIYYIDQVLDWAEKHKFQIFVSHVTTPVEYALSNLTQQAKDMILEKYKNNAWPEMKKILELIKSLPTSDGVLFCQKTQWFDSIRNENFAENHPEIAKAMGYVYNKDL